MTKKAYLVIAIITLMTVFAWVVFDIIHARSQVETPAELQSITEPIDPNFDLDALK